MATGTKSIARYAIPGMVALLIGLPAAARRADEPVTWEQAQARAQREHVKAEHARALGAVTYKTGELQRAEALEAKNAALAEQLATAPAWTSPPSPIVEHYDELAQHYRAMAGGPAYKWGRVAWAEAQARHYESLEAQAQPVSPAVVIELLETPPPSPADRPGCETVSKPVVIPLTCAQETPTP